MAVLVVFYEGESKDDMKAITATANPDIISKMADAWEKEVDNFFIPQAEHTQSAVNQKVMAGIYLKQIIDNANLSEFQKDVILDDFDKGPNSKNSETSKY